MFLSRTSIVTLIGEVGHELSKSIDGAGQSQPRWLAMGSLFTAGGVLVGLNALFILLVAFGNITDFETNQAFVHHVLSMDTANFGSPVGQDLDPAVMWHAVGSRPLQTAAYIGIIAWELLAGVALGQRPSRGSPVPRAVGPGHARWQRSG